MSARLALNTARPVARRALPRNARVPARSYATEAPGAAPGASHLGAGLLGGGVVLGGVYGYYKWSGADKVVATAHQITSTAQSAKDKLADVAPGSAKEALGLAKSLAKSYAAAIPGGAYAIDRGFNEIESFLDTHGEEAQKLIASTYADLEKAVKSGDNAGDAVMKVVSEAGNKVQKLVGESSAKAWSALGEKYPEMKKQLGSSGEDFAKLAEKHGPEAQHILTDFYTKAAKLVQHGGLNARTYEEVKSLLEEKKSELLKFSTKAGSDAYATAQKASLPALEKLPGARESIDKALSSAEGYVGEDRIKEVKSLYAEIEKIASDSKKDAAAKTEAVTKLVEEKLGASSHFASLGLGAAAGKATDLASHGKKYLDSFGLGDFTKVFEGVDLAALKKVAEDKEGKGKELLESAYSDIREVLKKHASKASELAKETKKDGEKAVSK